jgi:glycosyltransferase involved in cell wall biosynthesis
MTVDTRVTLREGLLAPEATPLASLLDGHVLAVVIPAFNEETLIAATIAGIPDYVDQIVVIDDCSDDRTADCVQQLAAEEPRRITLICHSLNQGVGAAIATGYKWCRDNDVDVAVVMAGDNQMDPADLPAVLSPILRDEADYTKGNRLFTGDAWNQIPRVRYLGNAMMSFLTKIASGYWHVADSQ